MNRALCVRTTGVVELAVVAQSRVREMRSLQVQGDVLVLAPHADDEVIGCGGTLARHLRSGGVASVMYITCNGSERSCEAQNALAAIGAIRTLRLGCVEGHVEPSNALVDLLCEHLAELKPTLVFVPAFEDIHPDHRTTHRLLGAALQRATALRWPIPPRVVCYEGFSPLAQVTSRADISDYAQLKWFALGCFATQERLYRLIETCQALNRYRALTGMRRAVRFAEAFQEFDVATYLQDERVHSA